MWLEYVWQYQSVGGGFINGFRFHNSVAIRLFASFQFISSYIFLIAAAVYFSHSAFTLKDLKSLENEASKETFHLTAKLAPSWEIVGENLGLRTEVLKQIRISKSADDLEKLTTVWYKWFNHPEDFPKYPLTWKGLRKLLESCDKETAKQYFDFLELICVIFS